MRQIATVLILCALFLSILVLPSPQTKAGEDIPYIYYYSQDQEAFIVERADGSEMSVLAEYQLSEPHTQIRGAGWSPSAKWFTWNTFGDTVHFVNRDSSAVGDVFVERVVVKQVTWSPTEDLLLVRFADLFSGATENLLIYDPTFQQTVFEIRGSELNSRTLETLLVAEWSPDGSMLAVVDNATRQLMLIERDVFQIRQTISASGTASLSNPYPGSLPQWFSNDVLMYLSPDQDALVLHHIRSGEVTSIELPFTDSVQRVFKSPDGQYALIYTLSPAPEYTTDLWLFSLSEAQITLIQEQVTAPIANISVSYEAPLPESQWSDNGFAFFVDDTHQMNIINAPAQTHEAITTPVQGRVVYNHGLWTPENTLVFTVQSGETLGYQTYEYLPETDHLLLLDPENPDALSDVWIFSLSGRGYRAYNQFVEDPFTGERFPFAMQVSDPMYGTVSVVDVRWHPTKAWFFLISWAIEDLRLINVANLDLSIQAELGLCPVDSAACFGWMPPADYP
jgi:hypothetical protein